MTARQAATHALTLVEGMAKKELQPAEMIDVLMIAGAIAQTQHNARMREQQEVKDE